MGDVPNVVFSCGALVEDGRIKFRHALAAPTYVALVLDQLVADYSCMTDISPESCPPRNAQC